MMEQNSGESLFSKQVSPKIQATLALAGMLLFNLILGAFDLGGSGTFQHFPWMIAAAFMLVFSLFNSIFWLSSEKMSQYLTESIIVYIILALLAGLLAYTISGTSISDAGSIKGIFIIVTIGYIVFLAIMGTIKQLIAFFNREQEQKLSGKKRKKKRR